MPSPVADRPGLLIRDPFRYSDVTLIIPPLLVECLVLFDGVNTELDLREQLFRLTGDIRTGEVGRQLAETLSRSGFLEDEVFRQMREARRGEFIQAAWRQAAHAGSAYPAEAQPLRETLGRYMDHASEPVAPRSGLCAIAAPHVSPEGGWQSYRAAYSALGPEYGDRTFVVLGTSHYGEPEHFGLTRKPYRTPFGDARTDPGLVDWLAARAPGTATVEDYCHAIEHSIEFQVVFLQHLFGPEIRIVPVLCGPFARSLQGREDPEADEGVRRFLEALAEMAEREGNRLFWVLGIDMAHMGRRYGDPFVAQAGEGVMAEVAERDRVRIETVLEGDRQGFWELVKQNGDDLKWCGSAPLYTFMKAVPGARGELMHYEQWNIDPQSVVSFGGLAFRK